MEKQQLDEIRSRCDAATPGPWVINAHMAGVGTGSGICICSNIDKQNAKFIANARQDIPALLDEVERLTAERNSAIKRAEALERALRDSRGKVLTQCDYCMHKDSRYSADAQCRKCECWNDGPAPDKWEFDEARFLEGP